MLWFVMMIVFLGTSNAVVPTMEYKIALSSMCNEVSQAFEIEYKKFMQTGIESKTLSTLTALMTHTKAIQRSEIEDLSIKDQSFLCTTCRSAVNVMMEIARAPHSDEEEENDTNVEIDFFAKEMCKRLKIQPDHVCDGLIDLNLPIFIYIGRNSNVTADSLCGTILQGSSCIIEAPSFDWKLNIDNNGPAIKGHKSEIPSSTDKDLTVLHLTDIHYDPNYKPGSLAECEEPLCCNTISKDIPDSKKAGAWGDYRDCDVSWELYEDTLNHIKNTHKNIDYIYYTGDIIEHAVWKTSPELIKSSLKVVYNKIKKVFGDIPVIPLVGNHESHPLNVFAPPDVKEKHRTQWLYDFLAEEWSQWLPEETKSTIHKDGYYTIVPKPGFRIIALNNNDCYSFNWWIFYDPGHLSKQLQWLHDTLLEAEAANEYVHVLAHVPSGTGSCLNIWAREYRRVIERFHHIISGVFNGHTHHDEFNVFYTAGKQKHAINIGWNGGSLTPFSDVNPNYKTYRIDHQTYQVVQHDCFSFNLTEANRYPDKSPVWFKAYSFADLYGLKDLSPASLDGLLTKFTKDPELLHKYWQFKVKKGDPFLKRGCDNDCLMSHLCETATTQFNDLEKCIELQSNFQKTVRNKGFQ